MLSLPIICETPDCLNQGSEVNRISDGTSQPVLVMDKAA